MGVALVGLLGFVGQYLGPWIAEIPASDADEGVARLHTLSVSSLDRRRLGDTLSRLTDGVTPGPPHLAGRCPRAGTIASNLRARRADASYDQLVTRGQSRDGHHLITALPEG